MDIDVFCNALVSLTKKAEQKYKRKVHWKQLITFCERFSCVKADNFNSDTSIQYKHCKLNNVEYMRAEDYIDEVYRNIELITNV